MGDANAYDPVRGEDVQIDCHHNDIPHDFDVQHAVQDNDDPRDGTPEQARENPRLLSADLDHDPVEACQGTISRIVDKDCSLCGYDRATETIYTMADVHEVTCRRCGADLSRNPKPPRLERDRINELEQYAEGDGPVEHLGRFGGHQSRYSKGNVPVYGYSDGTNVLKWVTDGTLHSAKTDTLVGVTKLAAEHGHLDSSDVYSIADAAVDGDCLDPEEWGVVRRILLAAAFLPDGYVVKPRSDADE